MGNKRIIAITGGTGFIGKSLAEKHIQLGDNVRVLSRRDGAPNNYTTHYKTDLICPDAQVLRSFVDGADVIYHCAGELHDEILMERVHVDGTRVLLQAAQNSNGRWVQLSSVGAYGPCHAGIRNTSSQEMPQGSYERTKTMSDRLVKESGLDYTILRPSIVFGEGMPNQSMRQMASMIRMRMFFYVGRGAIMNYVHVDDVVRALIVCGSSFRALNKVYILSDHITIEEMVKSLSIGLGVKTPKLRLPTLPIYLLVKIFGNFPGSPLSQQRLNAITNRCIYDSSLIKSELEFAVELRLQDALIKYAQSIK